MKKSAHPLPLHSAWRGAKLERLVHYFQRHGIHPIPVQIPPYYERVELMTGGRGWVWHDGSWQEVLPGHLVWNKPGDQTIGRSDFENPYRCLAVTLVSPRRAGLGLPRFSQVLSLEEVANFTTEVMKLFQDETFDREVLRDFVLARLLVWVRLYQQYAQRMEVPSPLRGALEWIEKNYAQPCPIRQLARQAGWSVAHFHEMFRRHLETTPHQVLARCRLRVARESLVSTSHPVKRIAAECGFADGSALIHAFKAGVGITPSAYRKRYMKLVLDEKK
ncbi:MAG: AraC family transcriptional regulator [Methylacidiphilales bacterium]|nr:AraC family transcriptional regulator [Candidatus Methylacidiphilales bacterium]